MFRWLAGNSSDKLDIMAQYWQLIAQPNDPRSGDYGYSEESMKNFGSGDGSSVYKSIEDAADRDVNVRYILLLTSTSVLSIISSTFLQAFAAFRSIS